MNDYLESFCNATNLSASLFLFHCSDYDFLLISKIRLSQTRSMARFYWNGKKSLSLARLTKSKSSIATSSGSEEMSKLPWSLVDFQSRQSNLCGESQLFAYCKKYRFTTLHTSESTASKAYERSLCNNVTKGLSHACGLRCVIRNEGKYTEALNDSYHESFVFSTVVRL